MGKRAGTFGSYLLACYDENNDEFQSVCKCMSGFTDEFLVEATTLFKGYIVPTKPITYRTQLQPDVWFDLGHNVVWEIKGADLSISPVHSAAAGFIDPDKGISLRFPRIVRVRPDKTPDDASHSTQVLEMYRKQSHFATNDKDPENE